MVDPPKKLAALLLVVLCVGGCGSEQPAIVSERPGPTPVPLAASPIVTREPTSARPTATLPPTATVTSTPIPATGTPTPTRTDLPPTPTVPLSTPTPQEATHSVCSSGCDFTTVQAAVRSVADGAVIEVRDPIHTEAGVVVGIDVTLRGLGADTSIVQGHESLSQAPERVLLVEEGATVVLEKLTIRHGRPSTQEVGGGGIMNLGTLTLRECVISNNSANDGAGIYNRGDLTLVDTTVRDNVADGLAPSGFECGSGGGIKSTQGTLTLINSTVSGNRAGTRDRGKGGGVFVSCECRAEIINSTISGNRAVVDGGGISIRGDAHLANCTISNNITRGQGAGVFVRGRLDFENTIVAGNWGDEECVIGGPGDYRGKGEIGMNRGNLIADGSCDPSFAGDAGLVRLADNGGFTLTHALDPGSVAIDAIPAAGCTMATDQRGAPRPVVRTSEDTPCDIGAFELQAQ